MLQAFICTAIKILFYHGFQLFNNILTNQITDNLNTLRKQKLLNQRIVKNNQ